MAEPAVQVCKHTNGEGAESVRNRSTGGKFHVGEEVDRVSSCCDEDHNRHLLELGLDSKGSEEDVERNEDEVPVRVHWVLALRFICSIRIHGAVNCCADSNPVTKEQGINDSENKSDRAWYDGARLKFQGGAENKL